MGKPKTELLSPAGNWDCARAAVANGADAIYFGMPTFNARIRADNFSPEDLPDLMAFLHEHGVRGFVAFNTLIFPAELEAAAEQLRLLSGAGVDAIIVQDLGLAKMARAMVPDLDVHASTQMTITSPEALAFADELFQLDRAVIARENSMKEIRLFHPNEPGSVELETFVHGALCVAYSGQCLTSESLGQRSANRGECAQACRMPYELVVDGVTRDMGDKKYLLSPQDLAGIDQIPQLIELGVVSFKIEGRLKTPEYVAAVTRAYRKAIDGIASDAVAGGTSEKASAEDRYELEMAFSRGLSTGWLEGINNKRLVHARFGKKRGAFIGKVSRIGDDWIEFSGYGSVKNGDGIVFDTGKNTDREQGGRVYEVDGNRLYLKRGKVESGRIELGARIWKTDDPALNAKLQSTYEREHLPTRNLQVQWSVTGSVDKPLVLTDEASCIFVSSEKNLEQAQNRPLTQEFLEKQFSRLGNTVFDLASLDVNLEGEVMLPVSELNRMRRDIVEKIDKFRLTEYGNRREESASVSDLLPGKSDPSAEQELRVLCRTEEQIEAALEADLKTLYVANALSAGIFMQQGVENLTVSYDLNIEQVIGLLDSAPPDWFELTLHQHMPMFHMEHCVFCTFLSKGTDVTNCGRPCDTHEVQLRDRVGQLHTLTADVGCRNTLYNGRAQTGARFFNALTGAGLRRFRVELLKENKVEAAETIAAYQALLKGDDDGRQLWERLQLDSRLGVVEGTLEVAGK